MDVDALIDILNEMKAKKDFSKICELVPYEDRFALFMKTHSIDLSNPFLYQWVTEKIFTEQEASVLFDQIEDKDKRKILFEMLSDEDKIKNIDKVEISNWAISGFLDTVKDEELRLQFTIKFMNQGRISTFFLKGFFDKFTGANKFKFLDALMEFLGSKGEKINSFDYSSYLDKFEEKDRMEVLKKLMGSSIADKIYTMQLPACLKLFSSNEREIVLELIVNKFCEDYKNSFYNIAEVLACFDEEEYIHIFSKLCDSGVITTYNLVNIFDSLSIKKSEEIVDYLINSQSNKDIVNAFVIAQLIDKAPDKDKGKELYRKYTIDSDLFGNLTVARKLRKVEDTYYYIDYLIEVVKKDDFEKAFDVIDENLFAIGRYPKGDNEYPNIEDMYVKKFNVDKTHLREFIKRFDYNALRFMNSKSVRAVINLSDEDFVKFMNIFNHGTMLDNNIINTICNSFLQREFRLVNKEDYMIFSQFEMLLSKKVDETSIQVAELLVKVGEVVDIDSHLKKNNISFDQFVYNLMNDDKNAMDLLHDMTQEYIMKKRESFVKEKLTTVFDEIGVVKKVEKNVYKKKMIELEDHIGIRVLFQSIPTEYLTDEERALVNDSQLVDRLFNFKKERTPLENPEEKKFLRVFESIFNKAYEYKYNEKKFEGIEGLPYSYYPVAPDVEWFLGIIVECNVDQIVEKVLNDKGIYNQLIAFLEKYKMLGWEKTFNVFGPRAEIDFTEGTMASIISNFYTISAIAKEKDANLTQFLDYANCYDSLSKTYSYILGKDNYRAIAANEGRNKADMSKSERLGRVPRLIQGMYAREEITTPPIDKDYETSTGKKLNIVLGNSTNMINLSYGERTGACLRIGGAFNNLFEFCIHDKNGFHVRFTDPETGEFVSRVSGIRNGNTIFFNELRNSENPNYTNEDLIEVLKALSSELIEQTKNEECPIENVVITYDYAMSDYESKAVPTALANYPDAFYGLRFNITFDGKFVVLKTTNPDGSLVPYRFGADLAQTYETQRDKVETITDPDVAYEKISQLHLIDGVLKGYDIEEMTLEENSNIEVCIAGEDWYVYADSSGNIHQFVVEMSKHKDRAVGEMKASLEELKEIINSKQQGKVVGGV